MSLVTCVMSLVTCVMSLLMIIASMLSSPSSIPEETTDASASDESEEGEVEDVSFSSSWKRLDAGINYLFKVQVQVPGCPE
jgi:hypothetical protein